MGNKDGDDVQVAEIDVLIFHRDNFSFVLWGFLFFFFPCFFLSKCFYSSALSCSQSMSFLPQPPTRH